MGIKQVERIKFGCLPSLLNKKLFIQLKEENEEEKVLFSLPEKAKNTPKGAKFSGSLDFFWKCIYSARSFSFLARKAIYKPGSLDMASKILRILYLLNSVLQLP